MMIIYAVSCKWLEFAVGGKWQDKEQNTIEIYSQIERSEILTSWTVERWKTKTKTITKWIINACAPNYKSNCMQKSKAQAPVWVSVGLILLLFWREKKKLINKLLLFSKRLNHKSIFKFRIRNDVPKECEWLINSYRKQTRAIIYSSEHRTSNFRRVYQPKEFQIFFFVFISFLFSFQREINDHKSMIWTDDWIHGMQFIRHLPFVVFFFMHFKSFNRIFMFTLLLWAIFHWILDFRKQNQFPKRIKKNQFYNIFSSIRVGQILKFIVQGLVPGA